LRNERHHKSDDKNLTLEEKKKERGSPRDLLRLLVYAKPYGVRLSIGLLSLLVGNLIGLAFPKLVQYLIDAAFVDRDYAKLNKIALIIFASFAVQALVGFSPSSANAYWQTFAHKFIRT
jgi:ABC-type bacteriocin/lantibiotic exporter with double-glycine peptidase domain